jgi:hypothetical protein
MKHKTQTKTLLLLGVVLFSFSCKQEGSDNLELKNKQSSTFEKINKVLIVEEKGKIISYYTKDSLSTISIDDGTLNNLGIGNDKNIEEDRSTIFARNKSLKPIVDIDVNESFTTKYIVSFDKLKANLSADSVLSKTMKLDSSYIPSANFVASSNVTLPKDSTIFINLIFTKRFGTIKLNLYNPNINDYLVYDTNLLNGKDKDGIIIAPETFKGLYGNVFKYSIVLGECLTYEIEILHADFDNNSQELALNEAVSLLKDYKNGNNSWDELKIQSKYLKKSQIISFDKSAIPRCNFGLGLGFDLIQSINYLESIYKNSDFGVLAIQYKPYSIIYPNYSFKE